MAVAVLDVLPRCLSSKYVFWDPALASLSLGKLTALREIAWVQDASCVCPQLHYYFQVSSCGLCHSSGTCRVNPDGQGLLTFCSHRSACTSAVCTGHPSVCT